jgi:hypothetical protein
MGERAEPPAHDPGTTSRAALGRVGEQAEALAAQFAAAMAPLVDAYLHACERAAAPLDEWARQVRAALEASRGVRGELGDPTGNPPGFTCPICGRTSFHPRDRAEGYCGACHDWTGQPGG